MVKSYKAINLGCGLNPIKNFTNYDFNYFIIFGKIPLIKTLFSMMPFIPKPFLEIMELSKKKKIHHCNVAASIPEKENSIDLIYSSHMVEHLDKAETSLFFKNCIKILKPGGILRIVVPDFDILIDKYLNNKDVDEFIYSSCLVGEKPKSLLKKLQYMIQGHGWHHQMFTKKSLKKKLEMHGYKSIKFFKEGESDISFSNKINYFDHEGISIYCECRK